jgi:hypothetical protein
MRPLFGAIFVLVSTAVLLALLYWNFASIPWDVFGGYVDDEVPRSQVFSYLVGPVSAVIAFVALLVSIASTGGTLRQGVSSENAGRFQKGVELLAEGKNTTIAAGVGLLSNLAKENPRHYLAPVANTFAATLTELNADLKARCSLFRLDTEAPYHGVFEPAVPASAEIVDWFGKVRTLWWWDAWPRPLRPGLKHGLFPLFMPYIEDNACFELNLSRTDIERAVFKNALFDNCGLRNVYWSGSVVGPLEFKRCDLRGARLKFWGQDNKRLWASKLVTFDDCNTDGMTINSLTYEQWRAGRTADEERIKKYFATPHPVPRP